MKKTITFEISQNWTLFLDRDGVINHRIPNDYIKTPAEFKFLPRVPKTIAKLSKLFETIIVVTNQRGIGKKLMTEADLHTVHASMLFEIKAAGGRIDHILFCPHLSEEACGCRKPEPGMGHRAKKIFPHIDFNKAIMVGDSISDMKFGKNLGMKTVFIANPPVPSDALIDLSIQGLYLLPKYLTKKT